MSLDATETNLENVTTATADSAIAQIQEIANSTTQDSVSTVIMPKRRGRPKGSKNKYKVDVGFAPDVDAPKRIWTRRKAALPTEDFMNTIVEPIMAQVAAGHMKKSIGMITAAICGRISSLTCTTATSPLQTLSSDITRFKKQPVYNGENVEGAKQVIASNTPLCEVSIPVYAQFNESFETPKIMIDSLITICEKHGVNSEIFTTTGGHIALTNEFVKVVTEFALNKDLWNDKPLIVHTPK